jgi:L-lactate dehydrogenase complex protein LldF
VHWARDAAEANAVVAAVAKAHGVDEVVKVKSMATQEIGLNEALAAEGIAAWETDLAELIVQLGDDLPSHILVPAIHRNRAEIRQIFRAGWREPGDQRRTTSRTTRPSWRGRPPAPAGEVPARQGGGLRRELRVGRDRHTRRGRVEGNGRMCLTLPRCWSQSSGSRRCCHLAGPRRILRLLPRSSTGERMNPYTSTWSGVTPGDGPQEVHVVLLDNGRTPCACRRGRPAGTALHPVLRVPERRARSTSGCGAMPTARSTPARSARSSTR